MISEAVVSPARMFFCNSWIVNRYSSIDILFHDARNDKKIAPCFRGIGQSKIMAERFLETVFPEGVGKGYRMAYRLYAGGVDLIQLIHVQQYIVHLGGKFFRFFLLEIKSGQMRNIFNFFFFYLHQ